MWKLSDALPKGISFPNEVDGAWPEPLRPVGLEFEFENVTIPGEMFLDQLSFGPFWDQYEDGSLQNAGREFVTRPERISYIGPILKEFLAAAKKQGFDPSWRAGVHVHVQATDLTSEELFRFIMLYALFEPSLYTWVGLTRAKTRFCKPWWTGYSHLEALVPALASPDAPKNLQRIGDNMRYSALNLAALWKYGTVEFRHMAATFDYEQVMNWLHLIAGLFNAAKFDHWKLDKIVDYYDAMQHGPMAEHVFGKPYAGMLSEVIPNPGREVCIALRTMCEPRRGNSLDVIQMPWEELHKSVAGVSKYVELFEERHKAPKRIIRQTRKQQRRA